MKIHVEIHNPQSGYLTQLKQGLPMDLEVEEGEVLSVLLDRLKLDPNSRRDVRLNGKPVNEDCVLSEGDWVDVVATVFTLGGG